MTTPRERARYRRRTSTGQFAAEPQAPPTPRPHTPRVNNPPHPGHPNRPYEHLHTTMTAGRITDALRSHGGCTIDINTGAQPTTGYVVNHQGACPTLPEAVLASPTAVQQIAETLRANADFFAAATHLGAWHDKDQHRIVLDRVTVADNYEHASQLAAARCQRAFHDLATGTDIWLTT